jgi:uncharacterized membrane protein YdjX (TVP38/TMEM64 family)
MVPEDRGLACAKGPLERDNTRRMNRNALKFIALIVFIVSAFLLARRYGFHLAPERLRAWINGFGAWGPAVYMLIYAVAPSLMVPALPLTIAGGILFGPVWGSVYVVIGATIGASIAFLFARFMGRSWVEGFIGGGRLRELDERVRKEGWKIVAVTRLIPLFPFIFLNYAFGLTDIRFSHYVLATFLFMIPGAVAYVVFSSSLIDVFRGRVSPGLIIGIVLVIIVSLLPVVYKKYGKRKA